MKKYTKDLFTLALLLSLFVHLVPGLVVLFNKPATPKNVEVEFLSRDEFLKKQKQLQIVEQSAKRLNDEIDEKAKYLSRYNQKVIQETKAANHGKFQNETHQGLAPKSAESKKPVETKPKNLAKKNKSTPPLADHGDVSLPKLSALKPQFKWDVQAGIPNPGPVSQTDDHLKKLPTAGETMLSSREFVYYSYYSRIKERLRIYWEPKIKDKVQRIMMSGRRIASDEDRITKLIITLDKNGTLIRVQVMSESGLKDLDDAAVEAFQAAAPFPNPPAGIVDADGTIKIRWDMIIEVQAGPLKPVDLMFEERSHLLFV